MCISLLPFLHNRIYFHFKHITYVALLALFKKFYILETWKSFHTSTYSAFSFLFYCIIFDYMPMPQSVKNPAAIQETQEILVWYLGQEDFPGGGNGNALQYYAWKISWTEEPGGLQSVGSQRVGHNWSNLAQHSTIWTIQTVPYWWTLGLFPIFLIISNAAVNNLIHESFSIYAWSRVGLIPRSGIVQLKGNNKHNCWSILPTSLLRELYYFDFAKLFVCPWLIFHLHSQPPTAHQPFSYSRNIPLTCVAGYSASLLLTAKDNQNNLDIG